MTCPIDPTQFITMPLTLRHQQRADAMCRAQSTPTKAKQVFLNALAVQAVADYLQCMGIQTDLDSSAIWNPAIQVLSDTGSLLLPTYGVLECRPVLPDTECCRIPPDVWSDRIGYIAVQVNHELTEAYLVGFLAAVTEQEVPLSQFLPIDALLDVLYDASTTVPGITLQRQITESITHLYLWLQDQVVAGWDVLDGLMQEPQPNLSFRSAELKQAWVIRGKQVSLPAPVVRSQHYSDMQSPTEQVMLSIGILPLNKKDVEILVRVHPTAPSTHLPQDLLIQVLDEQGTCVMHAQARQTDMIQLTFKGIWGDEFGLQLSIGEWSFTEAFII